MSSFLLLIIGFVFLYYGGELLVRGSVVIATRARISRLVVGMTVVSFATSSPELFVSLEAIFNESSDIVLGNIIGSNIANIALVLGLTSIFFNINISNKTLGLDYPFLLFSTLVVGFVLYFIGVISALIGFVFLLLLSFFLYYIIVESRQENDNQTDVIEEENNTSLLKSFLFLFFGVFLLKYGADFLVSSAIEISNHLNIEERIIAVTVMAIGTSIPELATSIVAALKKEVDLAVGNIIGSNIFNLFAVLGFTAVFKNVKVVNSQILSIDYLSMLVLTLVFGILIYFFAKGILNRKKGLLLVMIYIIYIYFTIQ